MSYASTILADSPKAWYRMSEASGLIQDSSGNAMNADASTGTCNYHQTTPILSDPTDFAIGFTGSQRFEVPDNNIIDVGDIYTVEAWVKRASSGLALTETICDRGSGAFKFGIAGTDLPAHTNQLYLTVPGTGDVAFSSVAITDTVWHYCAVTKSGSTVAMYLDGLDRTGTVTNQTSASNTSKFFIGATRNADDFCQSTLDELALYGTALTSAKVQAHWAAAMTGIAWLRA